ncbi:hypothetical protein ACIBQ1_09795 [Nonomuraea sp. NPDC050153]|uniref:hypothetical protein n=1 Tax=Nonomuraea sp. NPDC050153 TaxID=3364359 RepID=UPI0037BC079D
MQDPPVVRLPGHPAKAGYLLEWRKTAHGEWEALVEYVIDVPGFRGSLEPHTSWMRAHEVEPVKGEDYSNVPRTRT